MFSHEFDCRLLEVLLDLWGVLTELSDPSNEVSEITDGLLLLFPCLWMNPFISLSTSLSSNVDHFSRICSQKFDQSIKYFWSLNNAYFQPISHLILDSSDENNLKVRHSVQSLLMQCLQRLKFRGRNEISHQKLHILNHL
jgi:hypothetical protein